ncbi:hypothetical protein [uncultured Flavobacterium sp.]|uniref:hypothetical protein n=1 Tax=uncultured Flavobacterium sp. TaxID=165435 RepID=UPI0025F2DB82|nr:hypothetical protein [uncultured Flavobacterium sp.]
MKLTKLFLTALVFSSFNIANAQNVRSDAEMTSGGLEAGAGNLPGVTGSTNGNTFYGYRAGSLQYRVLTQNTFIGHQSGENNYRGSSNTFIGYKSGNLSNSTYDNTFIGTNSGLNNTGSRNIFIGSAAGSQQTADSDKLFIENSSSSSPLIWGDFALDQLKLNGKVGIGTGFANFPTTAGSVNVSNYNLFVRGGILTEEVRVNLQSNWADYVFSSDYKLKTLDEVESYITKNGHLENVPSAKKVKEEGIELGEMLKIQQEKIEELTLYLIQQNKEIKELRENLKSLKN